MTEREKMVAGEYYVASDPDLTAGRAHCQQVVYAFNQMPPQKAEERMALIQDLFGSVGKEPYMEQPFHCDYGCNIEVGDYFYSNYNLTILDCGPVRIGSNVMIAPNVGIYTAGHPLNARMRCEEYKEFGKAITIGDNVWIGANAVINPGVTIGDNCVIGSGSVVTKDIPANTLAAGNPCRVIREIDQSEQR